MKLYNYKYNKNGTCRVFNKTYKAIVLLRYKQNVRLAKDPAGIHIYFESFPRNRLIRHDTS